MESWTKGKMAKLNFDFHDGSKEIVLAFHLLKEGLLWRKENGATPVIAP